MAARKKTTGRKQSSSKKKTASKKSTSRRSAPSRKPADAIALLRADHKTVQDLFEKFEKTRADERKSAIAEQICKELSVHAQIEEEIFYPAAREVLRDEDLIEEATVEHQSAKDLIAQIEGGSPDDELWEAKVKVLGEYVNHHVKEEQNEMFPKVKKTRLDLRALGEQLQTRKTQLMEGGGGGRSRGSSGGRGGSRKSGAGKAGAGNRSSGAASGASGDTEGVVARMARSMGLASGT